MNPRFNVKPFNPKEDDFQEWWDEQAVELFMPSDISEQDRIEAARSHLIDYITFTFPQYIVDEFHRHASNMVERVVYRDREDSIDRLMLYAPPQHGKSEIVSVRAPGFWLAKNPDLPVALVSYAQSLAERNSRMAQQVMMTPEYFRLFPGVQPDEKNWRVKDWHVKDHKGFGMPVGVGGPITGHGFGLLLVDDPIENWAAAQSETLRENTWQWYQGTLMTRLWEFGAIILMMTRWHKDDLAGRILENEGRVEEGGRWNVLEYPALALEGDILGREIGEALAPSRYSAEYLADLRDNVLGRMVWMAEYQQSPTDPEGDFFKVGRFNIEEYPPAEMCEFKEVEVRPGEMEIMPVNLKKGVRFWDLAATKKSAASRDPDYTSGTLMADDESGYFWVLDQQSHRMDPEQVQDMIGMIAKLDGRNVKIRIEQEGGAAGKSLIKAYQRMLAGWDVEGVPATGEKTVRATPYAAQVNAGNVILLKAPWNRRFIAVHAGFPNIRHDDEVDSASGAFNEITAEEDRFRRIQFMHI